MTRIAGFERAWFGAVNAAVEPVARAGLLTGSVCSIGVISLETIGRRSGKRHRVPVLAMKAEDYVLVATVRGERSDWMRNIEANPEVRYWLGGEEVAARAVLLDSDRAEMEGLPRWITSLDGPTTAPARGMGWRFAVLVPASASAGDP